LTKTIKKEQDAKSLSSISSSSLPSKNKRIRTIFTQDQLDKLEIEFEKSQYMVGGERDELAKLLYLSPNQVKVWFQNRRIKYRKQHHEETQKRLAASMSSRIPAFGSSLTEFKESHQFNNEGISVSSSSHASDIDDFTSNHDDDHVLTASTPVQSRQFFM
jgi:hypothetical protein